MSKHTPGVNQAHDMPFPENSTTNSPGASNRGTELSLETLQILLTNPPETDQQLQEDELLTVEHERQRCLDLLTNTWHNKKQYMERISELKHAPRGADWLNRNLSIFQSRFPWELVSLIENMALNDSPQVVVQHSPDDNTKTDTYHDAIAGEIQGLQIFRSSVRRLITNNLESPLARLTPGILNRISDEELIRWSDWCETLEQQMSQVESVLEAGQRFFSESNFRLMEKLPLSQKSRQALQQINDRLLNSPGFK